MQRQLEELVWRRANGRCEYCRLSHADLELALEIDHIIARKHGGRTVAGTYAWPASPATIIKGRIYPELIR